MVVVLVVVGENRTRLLPTTVVPERFERTHCNSRHKTTIPYRYLGINASARASLYIYNTPQEVDTFIEALEDTIKFFTEL